MNNLISNSYLWNILAKNDYDNMMQVWSRKFAKYGNPSPSLANFCMTNYIDIVIQIDELLLKKDTMEFPIWDAQYRRLNDARRHWSNMGKLIDTIITHKDHPTIIARTLLTRRTLKHAPVDVQLMEVN